MPSPQLPGGTCDVIEQGILDVGINMLALGLRSIVIIYQTKIVPKFVFLSYTGWWGYLARRSARKSNLFECVGD